MKFTLKFTALLMLAVAIAGCSNQDMFPDPTKESPMAENEQTSPLLATLPIPKEPIAVSVYDFQDQTGQFKPNTTITDYSSAVTKGGLAVLTKALMDSGKHKWFKVAERGGLRDLLQERQIINTMRDQYRLPDGSQIQELPALIYSGIVLEGGIIFYDSNVLTGGAGAKYFGLGGSTQYSRDLVTVYLRAVSTRTGEVLASVTSSKTVYSIALNANAFRYLSFDRLLEAEAGVTVNEPGQLAIRRAIETAVYSLVMEGANSGLWEFADNAAGQKALALYLQRRDTAVSRELARNAEENGTSVQEASAPQSIAASQPAPAPVAPEPVAEEQHLQPVSAQTAPQPDVIPPAASAAPSQLQTPSMVQNQSSYPEDPAPPVAQNQKSAVAASNSQDLSRIGSKQPPLPRCDASGCCVFTKQDGTHFKSPSCDKPS